MRPDADGLGIGLLAMSFTSFIAARLVLRTAQGDKNVL
jgi:hypothetical protein